MRDEDDAPSAAVDPGWLGERLAAPAQAFGIHLTPNSLAALARYATELLSWRRRINLTGARTPEVLADEHLADALALVPHLPSAGRMLDVGAGGGLPGIPLAILRPDLGWVLLEPRERRSVFLRHVVRQLSLHGVDVLRERLEAYAASEVFERFDGAVSRAVWPLPEWLERGRALVVPGGRILGLAGALASAPERSDTKPQAGPGWHRYQLHPYRSGGRDRAVAVVRV